MPEGTQRAKAAGVARSIDAETLPAIVLIKPFAPPIIGSVVQSADGLKLHFGNSDVNVDKPSHLAQLKRVFRTANRKRMAILVHSHANRCVAVGTGKWASGGCSFRFDARSSTDSRQSLLDQTDVGAFYFPVRREPDSVLQRAL